MIDKPTLNDSQSEDDGGTDRDPESVRDLIPGNIPLIVAVATIVLLGAIAVLMALGR